MHLYSYHDNHRKGLENILIKSELSEVLPDLVYKKSEIAKKFDEILSIAHSKEKALSI